jgi:hypothetical protein
MAGEAMTQTVAQELIDVMVEAGIRNLYGVVGVEAGAFAAGADAQISGRPTAVLGSSGPGSLHSLNGLYDCGRNGAPAFAIVTHVPTTETSEIARAIREDALRPRFLEVAGTTAPRHPASA